MPDITMCDDNACPDKLKCYRYTAKPNEEWQAYFADSPRKDNICEFYWPVAPQDKLAL